MLRSHPPLGRRPDELVHLELKADRERVRDDSLGQPEGVEGVFDQVAAGVAQECPRLGKIIG